MAAIDVILKKLNKIYTEGEVLAGVVVVQGKGDVSHQGLNLALEGSVQMQLSAKSVGMFEAFYNSIKPIVLISCSLELAKPGKLPSGRTEIPFQIPLNAKGNKKLFETYHGVFINIKYSIKIELKRSLLAKDLHREIEFVIENKTPKTDAIPKPILFKISPETLQNIKDRSSIPKFLLSGRLDSDIWNINDPFQGELIVDSCESTIKSIELQLVRVETCGCAEGYAKDATEIQNIQIGEGDVWRGIPLSVYMIFPRLFTCPTLNTTNFKIEFEVNIIVVFHDNHLVTENFPITLVRPA